MINDAARKGSKSPDPLQSDVGRPEKINENASASPSGEPANPGDVTENAQADAGVQ